MLRRLHRPGDTLAVTAGRPVVSGAETIVLYSHDTYGLGHLRRNLAIAYAVHKESPETRIVMLTGSPVAEEMRGGSPVRMA